MLGALRQLSARGVDAPAYGAKRGRQTSTELHR